MGDHQHLRSCCQISCFPLFLLHNRGAPPSISKKLKLSIANLKRITVGMDEHGNLANALIFFPTTTILTSPADPKCLFIYAWVAFLSSFFFLSFFSTIFTFARYDQTPSSIYVFLPAAENKRKSLQLMAKPY